MMQRIIEYRANKILYNFLVANGIQGKVLLPMNICNSVVETLNAAKMELLFADIAPDTLCLDKSFIIENAKNCSVLLFVHTYGVEMNSSELFKEIRTINPHIVIIDDCCLCLPEWYMDESEADLVLYSTGAKKQVSLDEGGIGFISEIWQYNECDSTLFEKRTFVIEPYTLLQAEDRAIEHKEKLNAIYRANLPKSIQFPEPFQHWRFNIWVENKGRIMDKLFRGGYSQAAITNQYNPRELLPKNYITT